MPYPATSHTACVTYGIIEDILLKDYKLCAYASGGPNIEQEKIQTEAGDSFNHMLKRIKGGQKLIRQ